jgi:NAD(P)-dependent dehydrogenase (short-subunit alcohol dehydrogenase family)
MLLCMEDAVVVTATRGVGSALVRLFADRGNDVVAAARPSVALETLCEETKAVPAALDLVRPTELPPMLTGLSSVSALIHACLCSDPRRRHRPSGLGGGDLMGAGQETFAVNVTGPAELTRALLPALRATPGFVVFINAVAGLGRVRGAASRP